MVGGWWAIRQNRRILLSDGLGSGEGSVVKDSNNLLRYPNIALGSCHSSCPGNAVIQPFSNLGNDVRPLS